jgi:hypothetical protein
MAQTVAWMLYELRDTAQLLWYHGSELLVLAACALVAATWFSLRRT